MGDERTAPEKATITLVYHLVDDLRKEVNAQFIGLDAKFDELRALIDSMRDELPTRRECQYRHEEVDAAITAAVQLSEADRQKIWDATHAVEAEVGGLRTLVYKGVGAAAVLSIIFGAAVSAVFALLVA